MRKVYSLVGEIDRDLYFKILKHCLRYCSKLILILRDHHPKNSVKLSQIIAILEPYLLSDERKNEWPGTEVMKENGRVLTYKYDEEVYEILLNLPVGLYDWIAPDAPEDLSLIRHTGIPYFVSITHERDSYFDLTQDEYMELSRISSSIFYRLRESET
jgi:hypothetical protein